MKCKVERDTATETAAWRLNFNQGTFVDAQAVRQAAPSQAIDGYTRSHGNPTHQMEHKLLCKTLYELTAFLKERTAVAPHGQKCSLVFQKR